jgi:hypothetical protein
MAPIGRPDDDDRFLAGLEHLVADAMAEAAAGERSRERVLRDVAASEATFVGVALDVAETGAVVVARTAGGRSHRGRVLAVGRDFLVLRDGGGPAAVVATAWVSALRPQPAGPGADAPAGARRAPLDVGLAVLLAGLAAERPRVAVMAAGDEQPLAGELRAVGVDVATLRLDGDRRLTAHVRIPAITEVLLLDL